MDDYFFDQIIGSFEACYENGDCGDYYNGFDYDPNFHHHRVKFKLIHSTKEAYLLEVKNGHQFWCPKSLLRNVRINGDELKALLWDGFEPTFLKKQPTIDDFDIEPEPELIRKVEKRIKKPMKKNVAMTSTPIEDDDWFIKEFLKC